MTSAITPPPATSRFVPLSRTAHAGKHWKKSSDYRFAASQLVLPLVGIEITRAATSLPVVFVRGEGGYWPMALLGVEAGRNLFIDEQGKWLGDYLPMGLRSQPFALGRGKDEDRTVLCIDENSALLTDGPGEALFAQDGQLAAEVRKTAEFLNRIEQARMLTRQACELLERHHCIVPLPFAVKGEEGRDRRLEGLFQAGEEQLNALSDAAFLELRGSGALQLAYAQLVSLHKLPLLGALASWHANQRSRQAPAPVDLSVLDRNGTFDFGGLA